MDTETRAEVTYGGYLQLDRILSSQATESDPPEHDELLFIVVHQVFELWFKLGLHEIDALRDRLEAHDVHQATRSFQRLNRLISTLDVSIGVLESMSPSEFAKFRDLLMPASGFQSAQFRAVEFTMGLRDERFLAMFPEGSREHALLAERIAGPTPWDAFLGLLAAHGFSCEDEEGVLDAIVAIYEKDEHRELRMLCEEMIELDERFSLWREHHVRMAARMIGGKAGTGQALLNRSFGKKGPMGMMGVEYLNTTLEKRFFPLLWSARTRM